MNGTSRNGFTLAELLTVVVLGAVLILASYQVLITNSRIHTANSAHIQGQQALRAGLDVLVGELREIMFSGLSHMSKVGHILNIAVDKTQRKGGVGTLLMGEIETRFGEANATRVTLEVRESNAAAQSFYKGLGFNELGRARAYYPDEDAVVMSKAL